MSNHQATLKLGLIGVMSLLMLIPLGLVRSLVDERQSLQAYAEEQIVQKWGSAQVAGGPIAVFERTTRDEENSYEYHLPDLLDFQARLKVEVRYLGIFEMPVYVTTLRVTGSFDKDTILGLTADPRTVSSHWLLPLSDTRSIRQASSFKIGEGSRQWHPASHRHEGLHGIVATLNPADLKPDGQFQFELELAGARDLRFLPLGKTTTATLRSGWRDPSFIGGYLPYAREISEAGFMAQWQVLELNRPFGQVWTAVPPRQTLLAAAFGARLYTPVGVYQKVERSIKYGILFVTLTFMGFFVSEKLLKFALHPVQYIFIGAALCVFYLVLLALSEHLMFWLAYWAAAATLALMVGAYCAKVLGGRSRGAGVTSALLLIYALLYWLVVDEQYSLLVGALAILALLGATLYLTRNINWYGLSAAPGTSRPTGPSHS